jgi:DNA replication and repair protein RecF
VFIKNLALYHFRNLVDQRVEFCAGVNLVLGNNGQGKTNLVEAVHLLSTAKSFRTSDIKDLVKSGEREASVFAEVAQKDSEFSLGIQIAAGKRSVLLNNQPLTSLAGFIGKLLTVTFSPTDLAIVKGSPQGRRSFIDKHLIDLRPAALGEMLQYSRALKNKNSLLRGGEARAADLDPWDQIMARAAVTIVRERQALIEELQKSAATILADLCAEERLTISLESSLLNHAQEISAEAFMKVFIKNREREIALHRTVTGPHRDDVALCINGLDARSFASQGQARSIILALKLGVIDLLEKGREESPVLLLDDVDAELDRSRREILFRAVFKGERQIFVTGTELPATVLEMQERGTLLKLSAGSISPG